MAFQLVGKTASGGIHYKVSKRSMEDIGVYCAATLADPSLREFAHSIDTPSPNRLAWGLRIKVGDIVEGLIQPSAAVANMARTYRLDQAAITRLTHLLEPWAAYGRAVKDELSKAAAVVPLARAVKQNPSNWFALNDALMEHGLNKLHELANIGPVPQRVIVNAILS